MPEGGEALTTGQMIPSGTNSPPAEISIQLYSNQLTEKSDLVKDKTCIAINLKKNQALVRTKLLWQSMTIIGFG
jgi:hypothetical protein